MRTRLDGGVAIGVGVGDAKGLREAGLGEGEGEGVGLGVREASSGDAVSSNASACGVRAPGRTNAATAARATIERI